MPQHISANGLGRLSTGRGGPHEGWNLSKQNKKRRGEVKIYSNEGQKRGKKLKKKQTKLLFGELARRKTTLKRTIIQSVRQST